MFPARAISVLAHIPAEVDSLSLDVLPYIRARILESKEQGVPIKALLLCNPHNPIPQCYPLETIRGYLDIAREVRLFLVFMTKLIYSSIYT
jgi:aspartate/methionine/tyrosine aminotransferase